MVIAHIIAVAVTRAVAATGGCTFLRHVLRSEAQTVHAPKLAGRGHTDTLTAVTWVFPPTTLRAAGAEPPVSPWGQRPTLFLTEPSYWAAARPLSARASGSRVQRRGLGKNRTEAG